MIMNKRIDESLELFCDKVSDYIKSDKNIFVTTHIDCDGLTSGSIITKALVRAGARCTTSTTKEFSSNYISKLQNDHRNFHIITDLGGGFAKELDSVLGEEWCILDHHQISGEEIDNPRVINAWKYGIDGGTQICAGGMAYLAAQHLDSKNEDLSAIAVVSALGDRQDMGEKKSLTGKNQEIASKAKEIGFLEIDLDLLLVGRETRPLIDALAFTSNPFIEGLTWNRDACLALLNSSGIELKEGRRWRVASELTDDEKKSVIESIAKYTSGENATEIMNELIGYTYTFPHEDRQSFLRDGREFATMLNSCGRINRAGVGMAICMGDRGKSLQESEKILREYKKMIRDCMNIIANDRWRVNNHENYVMINCEGIIKETMTGTISSILSGSVKNMGKIIILRTNGEDGTIKFSLRKSLNCKIPVNLSELMRIGAKKFDGIGGGHDAAAGAKITKNKLDEFLKYLEDNVVKLQNSDNDQK